jgi:hypothetical protein
VELGRNVVFFFTVTNLSACHEQSDYHQELDQQFNKYMEDPSYIQDVDWRAQYPSGDFEGEFLDSQDGDWQRSGPSEAESSDLDS